MSTKYFSQLSIADHFKECRNFFESDKPTFFALLKEHINLSDFIPNSFYSAFYKSLGRDREYPLYGFLISLILQKILSIPSDSLLIFFLHLCKELREFCGFTKVPDASKFTRFKQDFEPHTFLGDSAFDTIDTYGFLKNDFHFKKAIIPYNPRNESTLIPVGYNEYGYPVCPNDSSLSMKYDGICREKGRADRIKWRCPNISIKKGNRVCSCQNPCSTAIKSRSSSSIIV